jgi:hypothetical protein
MEDQIPEYELDPDTQALLQTVLELALMSANLQLDPKNTQSVMDIVFTTAHRFGIEFATITQEPNTDQAGINLQDLPFDIQVTFIDNISE